MTIGDGTHGSYENIDHDEATRILLESNNNLILEISDLKKSNDYLQKWVYRLQKSVKDLKGVNNHIMSGILEKEIIKRKNIEISNLECSLKKCYSEIDDLESKNEALNIKLNKIKPKSVKIEIKIIEHLKENKYAFIRDLAKLLKISLPSALKYIKIAQMVDKDIKKALIFTGSRPSQLYYYSEFENEVNIIFKKEMRY